MKNKHRALSLILALVLCLSLLPVASAAGVDCSYSVIAGGVSHSLAVRDDGTVWAWGSNSARQAVPSSQDQSITKPTKVTGISSAVSVAAGSDFSAALLFDGTVSVWGGGSGISKIPGLSAVSSISAGQDTLLALKNDGTVWQWQPFDTSAPTRVPGLQNISAVSAGGGHYLALSRSGEVWAWGSNTYGQLGVGSSERRIDTPRKVNGLLDIVSVAAGYSHSLAVDYNGRVYAWGSNSSGQLGNDTTENSSTPQAVLTIRNAVRVSAGYETSMAIASSRVYTWGYGEYGQLGNNSTSNYRRKPEAISAGNFGTPLMIASGMNHNMLLNSRGVVYTWGRNRDGQLGNEKNSNGIVPQNINLDLSVKNTHSSYTTGQYSTAALAGMSSWAVGELTVLYNKNIVPPSLWERYTQNITRAEFAHLVLTVYEQVRKVSADPSTQARFQDIKNHPLEESILKAYQVGLLKGRSDTEFDPDDFMSRQEAAILLCTLETKLRGVHIPAKVDSLSYYSDANNVASWAIPYVAYAHDQNIMQGSGGRFNPTGYTTKEQALAIIARLVERYDWA